MQLAFWFDFVQRLRTTRPAFFKKLQILAAVLCAISAAFGWYVGHAMEVPTLVIAFSKHLATFCGSVFVTSFLPNADPPADKPDSPTEKS